MSSSLFKTFPTNIPLKNPIHLLYTDKVDLQLKKLLSRSGKDTQ